MTKGDWKYFIPFNSERFSTNIIITEVFRVGGIIVLLPTTLYVFFDTSMDWASRLVYGLACLVFLLGSYYFMSIQIRDYNNAVLRKEMEERKKEARKEAREKDYWEKKAKDKK